MKTLASGNLISISPSSEKAIEGASIALTGAETGSGADICISGLNCAPPLYLFLSMMLAHSSHSQHKSATPTSLT